ncbi:MAG: repair protein RadA, partial [Firmicutes bacterium]|nr:repair protein RadA [Bacillota bacterium]
MVEETFSRQDGKKRHSTSNGAKPRPITEVDNFAVPRLTTGVGEFDRVLGGGIVPGALILIGGDPGIGKSTMLLQVACSVSQTYGSVLYVSGEESAAQTKMRAERLNKLSDKLLIMTETNLDEIALSANQLKPALMIIDSIQTMYSPEIPSA